MNPNETPPYRLVLASQSPRRSELLTIAGIAFTVRACPVEEVREPGEAPVAYVRRLARAKAEASWAESPDFSNTDPTMGTGELREIVLAADTIVVLDHQDQQTAQVLEKPRDAADARRMLMTLSGRAHDVITGICLRHIEGAIVDHTVTSVHFAALTVEEIDTYVASGEPMDKAGAYAIQGLASKFVERVDGCFFNVVGLPVSQVYRYLQKLS